MTVPLQGPGFSQHSSPDRRQTPLSASDVPLERRTRAELREQLRAEVLDLHRYLEDWLRGRHEPTTPTPERLRDALADDFLVVHPDGRLAGRDEVVASFAAARGQKPAGYALQIRDLEVRVLGEALGMVTYVESHRGEAVRARRAVALLRRHAADGAIKWLFLQETPLGSPSDG